MDYFVSRQRPWDSYPAAEAVEVAVGRDGFSPGAVWVSDAFDNAPEAVAFAIQLAKQSGEILTLAMSDLIVADEVSADDLTAWAQRREDARPICQECGTRYDAGVGWSVYDFDTGEAYCSEPCADAAWDWMTQQAEEVGA